MCGIAVAIEWDGAEGAVRALVGAIAHRGDVTDPLVSPSARHALCTRRLRIVDAEHSRQPVTSWDGRILLAFNGEIYNHDALRRELTALGVRFATHGDTEVVAAALSVWGARALQRFSGMFAFVALDLRSGEFLAARDPLGIKPLYFIRSETGWLFCSEIKPLLETVETGDVLLLPPGHVLTRQQIGRYSSLLAEAPGAGSGGPGVEALDAILRDAVEAHLPADLPFASFFSGGIDSTLIAHYARQRRPEAPAYFLGDHSAPDYPYAASYADMTGLDLRFVDLDSSDEALQSVLGELVSSVETFEPEVVREAYCNWLLARAAQSDGFRVVLAGEGADELFAGYRPLELGFASGEALGRNLRQQTLEQMGRTNLQRLDRCTMRHSVEARVPFLDPQVVRAALSYGAGELVHGAGGAPVGKQPLRALYALHPGQLPAEIATRRKLGLHLGSGLDESVAQSPWRRLAEATITDRDLASSAGALADYGVRGKEELMLFRSLEGALDIRRVPHLRYRNTLAAPAFLAEAYAAA